MILVLILSKCRASNQKEESISIQKVESFLCVNAKSKKISLALRLNFLN